MLQALSGNPLALEVVPRPDVTPGHVHDLTRDVAAADAFRTPTAPAHLDAVGQKPRVGVGLQLLEGQPLGHLLHASHPLSTESLHLKGRTPGGKDRKSVV